VERGHTNIYTFIGGIPEWRKFNYSMVINPDWQKIKVKKLPPTRFKKLLERQDLYILDVRPLNFQRDTSFIEGAHLCPLVYLTDRYPEIPKNQRIVITDWAMKQSPTAAKFLTVNGFQIVGVLKGGMERWKSENLPYQEREPTGRVGPLNRIDKQ
jgi:rhodanese-related sulfurtransferase